MYLCQKRSRVHATSIKLTFIRDVHPQEVREHIPHQLNSNIFPGLSLVVLHTVKCIHYVPEVTVGGLGLQVVRPQISPAAGAPLMTSSEVLAAATAGTYVQ